MLASRQYTLNCRRQIAPCLFQVCQPAASSRRDGIVDAAAAAHRLAARSQSSIALQTMQHRINDAFTGCNHGIGTAQNSLDDFVSVHFLLLQQFQDQELRNSIHKTGIGFTSCHESYHTSWFKVWQAQIAFALSSFERNNVYIWPDKFLLRSPWANCIFTLCSVFTPVSRHTLRAGEGPC